MNDAVALPLLPSVDVEELRITLGDMELFERWTSNARYGNPLAGWSGHSSGLGVSPGPGRNTGGAL